MGGLLGWLGGKAIKGLEGKLGHKKHNTQPTPAIQLGEGGALGEEKSFKKGGRVKKTGMYKLHKNEVVVPASLTGWGKKK